MARKVFQHFAHVLCQKFIEMPSHSDLVRLIILGDGKLEMDLLTEKASHNRAPISPLPSAKEAREWLDRRIADLKIPPEELVGASLVVDYSLQLHRKPVLHWLGADFAFSCVGTIRAPDRNYVSEMKANKTWGLGPWD